MLYLKIYLRVLIPLLGIMAITTVLLFIIAVLPDAISRKIGKSILVRQTSDLDEHGRKNSHLMRKMEWIRFYPLKKIILFLLWLFCAFVSVMGTYVYSLNGNAEDICFLTLFYILTASTFLPVMKYIMKYYHCMPYLNKMLSKKEIDSLMEGEKFQKVLFSEDYLDKYVPIYKSADWLVARGTVISRKLTVMVHLDYGIARRHPHTWLEVYYVNGKKIKIDLGTGIYDEMGISYRKIRAKALEDFFSKETVRLEDFRWGRWGDRNEELVRKIVKKYDTLLPQFETESEKLLFLLKSDTTELKREIFSDEQIKRFL